MYETVSVGVTVSVAFAVVECGWPTEMAVPVGVSLSVAVVVSIRMRHGCGGSAVVD